MKLRTLFALLLIAGFIYNTIDIRSNMINHHASRMLQIEAVMNQ